VLKAVFLDRDGVINCKAPEGDYIKSWHEFEFLPGVAETIKTLNENHFKVIVVTNQRGIAKGLMTEDDLNNIHAKMMEEFRRTGAIIDGIYYCPHAINVCACRKPKTGMFLEAKKDFPEISFSNSFVIGDSLSDMEAGMTLSCQCILVSQPLGAVDFSVQWYRFAASLQDAVKKFILVSDEEIRDSREQHFTL
jgi:D-glycero-D-manno-heptose 1,7-bisphosphate phosphatase